jgi:hypothetical protein
VGELGELVRVVDIAFAPEVLGVIHDFKLQNSSHRIVCLAAMAVEEDLYAVLRLEDAGPHVVHALIRKAYRKRALELHPDKRGDDPVAGAFALRSLLFFAVMSLLFFHFLRMLLC